MKKEGKRKTYRMWTFEECETAAMAEYLEKMAEKGWFLKNISRSSVFCFEKGEPRRLTFNAAVIPGGSEFDNVDSDDAMKYRECCEEAGWKLQYGGPVWQVFYSEEENPTPIETDAELQLETWRSIGLSLGRWGAVLALVGLFLFQTRWTFKNPGKYLAMSQNLYMDLSLIALALSYIGWMLWKVWWYRKARRSVRETGQVPVVSLKSVFRRNILTNILCLLLVLSTVVEIRVYPQALIVAVVSAGISLTVCGLVLNWVQKHGDGDRRENAVGYFVGSFFIAWLAIMLVTGLIFKVFPNLEEEQEKIYVQKVEWPVTFQELGYEETDDWLRDSDRTILAAYQIGTGKRTEAEKQTEAAEQVEAAERTEAAEQAEADDQPGADNQPGTGELRPRENETHMTMEYYESPIPAVIAMSKRNYPIDRGNIWEVTETKRMEENGMEIAHYHYEIREAGPEADQVIEAEIRSGWESDARDLYVISDRNRILALEYHFPAGEEAILPALEAMAKKGSSAPRLQ